MTTQEDNQARGAATRALKALRRQQIADNPIDWSVLIRSIRAFMDEQDRCFRNERERQRRAEK